MNSQDSKEDDEAILATIIAEIQDMLNVGETIDVDRFIAKAPHLEPEIRDFLRTDGFLQGALDDSAIPLNTGDEETVRLDLKAFPIARRLPDIPLGTVYLLHSSQNEKSRELVVLRAWFRPQERKRIEETLAYYLQRPVYGLLKMIDVGRLNQVPFILREHNEGMTLSDLHAALGGAPAGGAAAVVQKFMAGQVLENSESGFESRREEFMASAEHRRMIVRLFAGWSRNLHRAHQEGVVHFALNPQALTLNSAGEAVIQGIGLASCVSGIPFGRLQIAQPQFLAPEILDEKWGPLTWKADVYSMGACLAYLLAAKNLTAADDAAEFMAGLDAGERFWLEGLPKNCPQALRECIDLATHPVLEKRLRSLEDLAECLEELAVEPRKREEGRGFMGRFRRKESGA